MKIVIIRTPSVTPIRHITSMSAVPDIGTAYLSAFLKSLGHNVRLIDAQGEGIAKLSRFGKSQFAIQGLTSNEILSRVANDVELILVSCMHSNRWIYDCEIIKKLIVHRPSAKIVVGGEHATACPEQVLTSFPEIHAVIRGEGEHTLDELIKSIIENKSLFGIHGVSYFEEGRILHNESRKRISDLDSLPFPDWSDVPLENYLSRRSGINSLYFRSLPVITSRGCPYSCHFCTCKSMWGSKWYARSHDSIIEEMLSLQSKYALEHIDIIDLTLSQDPKWLRVFAEKILARKVDLSWSLPIGTRTEGLDHNTIRLLRESGLTRVLFASETGSKKTAQSIGKEISLSHFYDTLKNASNAGIVVKVTLILGFPGQTVSELLESFKLIFKAVFAGVSDLVCLCFVPYPNTVFFKQLDVSYDYESLDSSQNININNDIPNMRSWSEHYSSSLLKLLIISFTLFFYSLQFLIRPWRGVRALFRIFVIKRPLTNFESIVYNLFISKKPTIGETYD